MQATETKRRFDVKPLAYSYTALIPFISEKTLRLHHDKHYVGYVENLNHLIEDTSYAEMSLESIMLNSTGGIYNNAAQAWNHEFYFEQFSPTPKSMPDGALANAIDAQFGSFIGFCDAVKASATQLFGSGWVWIFANEDNSLEIVNESNAGNPLTHGQRPIMTIDVWEHAYYVDCENRRADSVDNFWHVVDWRVIESRTLFGH